ncbi:MAG TPA: DUF1475 family protein [Steroidobacteraceae bacterium]
MTARTALRLLFSAILVAMLCVTTKASLVQPIWAWQGIATGNPDRWWTLATLADAYCGFLTFYAWVFYKEDGLTPRLGWLAGILLLGNIAMSIYALLQLARLRDGEPVRHLLLRPADR